MHTKPMSESEGVFDEYRNASRPCPRCGGVVRYRIWESSCGGYEDVKYECTACPHTWWVEGADA